MKGLTSRPDSFATTTLILPCSLNGTSLAYLDRMHERREKETAQKAQEQEIEKPSYESLPENDTSLSKEERKEAYIERAQQERDQNHNDGKDRGRE